MKGYTHEVLVYGDYEQAIVFTEHRYDTNVITPSSGLLVLGTLTITGTMLIDEGGVGTAGSLVSDERRCCPVNGAEDATLVNPTRTLTLSIGKTDFEDVRRLTLSVVWSPGSSLGDLEREWSMDVGQSALNYLSLTCSFDHANQKEYLRLVWADPEDSVVRPKSWNFVVDMPESPGMEFGALDLFGPEGVLFTGLRSWAAPLSDQEIRAHYLDVFSWGTQAPLDEAYTSLRQPSGSEPEFTEDPFVMEAVTDSPWSVNPNSRRKRLLVSSWDSFNLRGSPDAWVNTVTCEEWKPEDGEPIPVQSFSVRSNSIDPKWDESTSRERVRVFEEIRDSINPTEQNASDWRLGLESSPTSALDRDMLRGLAENQTLDDWIGGPENLTTFEYPSLNDWRNSYFGRVRSNGVDSCTEGRVVGAIPYLPAMRLHRWIRSNLRGLIEELVPYNVAYLGFNNVIEPLATERSKVLYPGSERFLEPQDRLDPRQIRLVILNAIVNRF